MIDKTLILVTNDDGIYAPGIRSLISVMNDLGKVVWLPLIALNQQWGMP